MGTSFSLAILGTVPTETETLVAAIKRDFAQTESRLSVLRPDSEISQWQHGRLRDGQLSVETREVIAACDLAEEITGGLFSAQHTGQYDPTCYVKGWALARAARRLDDAEVGSYYLNCGGSIIACGDGPDGAPWRLGVAHPYRQNELATVITAPAGDRHPIAVATSGTRPHDSHIYSAFGDWHPTRSTVTVVGQHIALVDMAASAALAAGYQGFEASRELIRHLGLDAFGFDENRHLWWTDGMPRYAALPGAQWASETPA